MPETRIGKAVHQAVELALGGMVLEMAIDEAARKLESTDEEDRYRRICCNIHPFLQRLDAFRQQRQVKRQLVERQLAISEDGASTAFYAGTAFFRGVIDLGYLYGTTRMALIDHKTGLRDPNPNIVEQLEGYAVLARATYERVAKIFLGVHWILTGDIDWSESLPVEKVDDELRPAVFESIEAAALAVADGPRAQESPWCLRCSYRSVCPEAQKARFEPLEEVEPGLDQ